MPTVTRAPPKTTAAEVSAEFRDEVAVIVGGETGGAVPSTVVDATGESLRLLRSGAYDFDELRSFLNREPLVDFPPLGGVEQLVRAAQRGDPVAMDALPFAPCRRTSAGCAVPSCQNAWTTPCKRHSSPYFGICVRFEIRPVVHGWVRRIVVREAVRAAKGGSGTGAGTSATHAGIDGGSGPMAPPVDLDTVLDVRAVLEELSPEHRAVLVLRDPHGLAEVDVATLLGVAEVDGQVALHRARKQASPGGGCHERTPVAPGIDRFNRPRQGRRRGHSRKRVGRGSSPCPLLRRVAVGG